MNTVEKELHNLREVRPSQNLYNKLDSRIVSDSALGGINMPLLAFRLAIASVVLIVFVSVSSGVILAAKGSSEGSILFPVRQALEKLPQPFHSSPSLTPTPTVRIHSESEDSGADEKATTPGKLKKIDREIKNDDNTEHELEKHDRETENTIENVLHAATTPTITLLPSKKDD